MSLMQTETSRWAARITLLLTASLVCAGSAGASRFQLVCEQRCDHYWGDDYLECMDGCLEDLDPVSLSTSGERRHELRRPEGWRQWRSLPQPAAPATGMRASICRPGS